MKNPTDILTLLGIPAEKVSSFDFVENQNGESHIELSLINEEQSCPRCFSKDVVVHGYFSTTINNSVIRAHKTYVRVEKKRYKCKRCGKTFCQSFPINMPHKQISRAVEICILDDLKEPVSYSYVARQYNVSLNTVVNLFDRLPRQPKLKLSECICIDEFHFSNRRNRHCCFPCVISNPFTSEIIDIIESRRYQYLWSYFVRLRSEERFLVKYFVSDMNDTYRRIKKAFFNHAVHIVDHFHVMKMFTGAIQAIRIKIMKMQEEENREEYKFLKRHWRMFLKNRTDLRKLRKVNKLTGEVFDWELKIMQVLRRYPELYYAYEAKEEFYRFSKLKHSWDETKTMIQFFIQKFGHSESFVMQKIAHTMSNWFVEICNAYSVNTTGKNLTNAIAESNNNHIQTLIDVGYGYGVFERLRNRILYINRKP